VSTDTRLKNMDWTAGDAQGAFNGIRMGALIALLMDIRDRLDRLNCPDFIRLPLTLKEIERNTRKPRRARKVKP
jgi:hypothetical protein